MENCIFRDNSSESESGVYAGGLWVGSETGTILLRNNVFYGNTGPDVGGAYITSGGEETIFLTNNTFYGNEALEEGTVANSVLILAVETPVNIYNNIMWNEEGNGRSQLLVRNDNGEVRWYNNILNSWDIVGMVLYSGDNMVIVDPLLEDPAEGDFHLQAVSPCRNSGYNDAPGNPDPDADFEGQPRPMEGTVDIGADEYEASIPVSIPTMNEWGMILFALLAASGAVYFMRKQRADAR